MNKGKGKIVYRFKSPIGEINAPYLNIIHKYACTNECRFCDRPRNKTEFGKNTLIENNICKSLLLYNPPTIEDIIESLDDGLFLDDKEITFTGLGEPLIYFNKVLKLLHMIKEIYFLKIRVDTNGHVACFYKNPVEQLENAGLDKISISLNAVNETDYNNLCNPKSKNAFNQLIDFVKKCNASKIDTSVSFIIDFVDLNDIAIRTKSKEDYIFFAKKLGLDEEQIKFRTYKKL